MPQNCDDKYKPFALRAWQIQVFDDADYTSQATDKAIVEAKRYGITHIEFANLALTLPDAYTDNPSPPCRNWVLCGQSFRDFPKLARHDVLHNGPATITRAERQADFDYTRDLFGRVKAAGLGVIAWHHVRRDLPDELSQEYPDAASSNLDFLRDWEQATLSEFFEILPEVDMIAVTSMTETPGVADQNDRGRYVRQLAGVFEGMNQACRQKDKTLIIRDWGSVGNNAKGPQIFHEAIESLPHDVCIHIKNVLLDFVTNAEIPNPNANKYPDRPLIVEFDVYGEYFGRADIPYVDPQHYCQRLDSLYAIEPYGVTARIAFEVGRKPRRYASIFESPNAANAVAFSRWSQDAAQNKPINEWLSFLASSRRWQTYFWQWLADRYGPEAGPLLANVFGRTPQIAHGIFAPLWSGYWHSFNVMEHTTLPWPPTNLEHHGSAPWNPPRERSQSDMAPRDNDLTWVVGWLTPNTPIETIGWSQLVARKRESLRLAQQCVDEIADQGPSVLQAEDFADLDLLFKQLVMICQGDLRTGQILAAVKGPSPANPSSTNKNLEILADESQEVARLARTAFGDDFFGEFPLRMEAWAGWARSVAAGNPPDSGISV